MSPLSPLVFPARLSGRDGDGWCCRGHCDTGRARDSSQQRVQLPDKGHFTFSQGSMQLSCHIPAQQLSHATVRAPWYPSSYCHNFPARFVLLLLFRVFRAKSTCFSVLCATRSWWKPLAPRTPHSPRRTAAAALVTACWEDVLGSADNPGAQTQLGCWQPHKAEANTPPCSVEGLKCSVSPSLASRRLCLALRRTGWQQSPSLDRGEQSKLSITQDP